MQLTRALAATSDPGVWTPADMPEWAVPAAFGILTIVYALIVFEIVHRALAAAIGGIVAVVTLHAIGTMCFDSVAYKNVVSNGLVLSGLIMEGYRDGRRCFRKSVTVVERKAEGFFHPYLQV